MATYVLAMPRHCGACKMVGGMGHSLHVFPKSEMTRRQWISAVKLHRKGFDSLSSTSRHFTEDSYVVEGQRYCDDFGIPSQKRLKADAVPKDR